MSKNKLLNDHNKVINFNGKNEIRNDLQTSTGISVLNNPFMKNFENFSKSILKIFKAENLNMNMTVFYRYADNQGNILDKRGFSLDNLLIYRSIGKHELTGLLMYFYYKIIRNSNFWYEGNHTLHQYGFIESINGTTGEVINYRRNLIDNLIPIFILIENNAHKSLGATEVKNLIREQFELINSSQFWDNFNIGFNHNNESASKYSEDNFYAIMVNLLIHRTTELESTIRDQAYNLANQTMLKIMEKMWDNTYKGFYYQGDQNWTTGITEKYKYLKINALGILTLLDYWLDTGMNKSSYIDNATELYNLINLKLWNSTYQAYEYRRTRDWSIGVLSDRRLDLESNAIMMKACLKLFELTGNISYYNRAIDLYNFFENNLYNKSLNAYVNSIGAVNDTNINFYNNLKLGEAYLYASHVFNSSELITSFNSTQDIPDLIINQSVLNLTSAYNYKHQITYYDPQSKTFKTYYTIYNITGNANISYIFRYPNGTIFDTKSFQIKEGTKGSVSEQVKIVCKADVDGSLNETYFNISTPSKDYFIWFSINNSVSNTPSVPGKTGINVSTVNVNDSADVVAQKLETILNSYENGEIFGVSRNSNNLTITILEKGVAKDAGDGPIGNKTGFEFYILTQGENKTITTHTLLISITENFKLSKSFKEYLENSQPYLITIYTNTTWFSTVYKNRGFNIISGLTNKSISGLDSSTSLYQGETTNITLTITSIRNNNITLNFSLVGEDIINVNLTNIKIIASDDTEVKLNITINVDASVGIHSLNFIFKRGSKIYLKITKTVIVKIALDYSNFIYNKKVAIGEKIPIYLDIMNFLPNNPQSFNLSFTGKYIEDYSEEITLNQKELKGFFYELNTIDNIIENEIEITMNISKGLRTFYSKTFSVEIVPPLEFSLISFPDTVPQFDTATLIIQVINNKDTPQAFTLYINNKEVKANIEEFAPGINRLEYSQIISLNPYNFDKESFIIVIKDDSGNILYKHYFEVQISISTLSLMTFYILPIAISIGIILYYKNKEIKFKLLKR
ncbi:MAG: hypothetical protein ACP6IY_07825 [Promethearchaeia archaeon]